MPQLWKAGPHGHWLAHPFPQEARGLPLVDQILELIDWAERTEFASPHEWFWLVFEDDDIARLREAGKAITAHKPVESIITFAIRTAREYRKATLLSCTVSPSGWGKAVRTDATPSLAIRFGP